MSAPEPPSEPRPDQFARTSMTLLARIRAEDVDQQAWTRLVFLYDPQIRIWASRRGANGSDADDVVQDVFHEVRRGIGSFRKERPGDTFRGWLSGVTRNILLRRAQRLGRQFPASGGTAALMNLNELPQESQEEPDSPAELNALYRRGLELVRAEFEARTWKAFWEHVVVGRKPADVAAELGVSPAAIRQAKSRVLRRLKEELGDLME